MVSGVTITHTEGTLAIKGVPELIRKLDRMGKGKQVAKVLRSAVRSGMKATHEDAKSGLAAMQSLQDDPKLHPIWQSGRWQGKVMPGYAARHIALLTFVSRDEQAAMAVVGPWGEAFYASQWVEFGIKEYGVPARPWLEPALKDNATYAQREIARTIKKRVETLARQRAPGARR